ncbi:hypothetical protein A9Q78_04335 [Methylophaga sp. 41_12_T18]|nr:hypothetical protein A9Q78_04335 [Methylophaga sp. 41_12_T18]
MGLIVVASVMMLPASAATLNTVAGEVVGIDNVEIDGSFWNASFDGGSWLANSLSLYDIAFAESASEALKALILSTDAEFVVWDANAQLTRGCSYDNACTLATPYEISLISNRVEFYSVELGTPYPSVLAGYVTQTTSYIHDTYVQWSQVSAVPIPAAVWLFTPALVGLLGIRRKVRS